MLTDYKDEPLKLSKMSKKEKNFLLRRLLVYLKPYKKKLILIVFIQVLFAFFDLLPMILIGKILDLIGGIKYQSGIVKTLPLDYIPPSPLYIFLALFAYAIIVVTSAVVGYYKNLWLDRTGQKIVKDVRRDVFSHIQTLDLSQVNEIPVGTLVTRVINNTESLEYLYSYLIVDFIYTFSSLLMYFIAMFYLSYKLAVPMLGFIFLILILTIIFRFLDRRAYRHNKKRESELNAFLSENLSGMKIIQVFNKEEDKKEEFSKISKKLKNSQLKTMFVHSTFRPFLFLIARLAEVCALYLSIKYIVNGEITYGVVFSFYTVVNGFFWPIISITDQFDILQNALAAGEKVFSILDLKPSIKDIENAKLLKDFKGNIEFKNVWFKYKDDEWILKNVSFKVSPNETVAIVGPTGAGKTTILNLIVKNYLPQKGEILLDGVSILELDTKSIRSQIGQMLQDVFLFSGTIYDNLTFGDNAIKENEVMHAIDYVGARKIIEKEKDGLMAFVNERGSNYSAGERQLLSFARAFLYKPAVMFLDEATANIDSETEKIIQNSLKKLMKVNTMLVVAHRLSTIKDAKKIIVLQNGKIVEEGTHSELIKNKSHYYKLNKIQEENI